jgi:hypothetical protein
VTNIYYPNKLKIKVGTFPLFDKSRYLHALSRGSGRYAKKWFTEKMGESEESS